MRGGESSPSPPSSPPPHAPADAETATQRPPRKRKRSRSFTSPSTPSNELGAEAPEAPERGEGVDGHPVPIGLESTFAGSGEGRDEYAQLSQLSAGGGVDSELRGALRYLAGIPQDNTSLPQDNTSLPQDNTGLPRDNIGLLQDNTGLPQDNPGPPQDNTGGVTGVRRKRQDEAEASDCTVDGGYKRAKITHHSSTCSALAEGYNPLPPDPFQSLADPVGPGDLIPRYRDTGRPVGPLGQEPEWDQFTDFAAE